MKKGLGPSDVNATDSSSIEVQSDKLFDIMKERFNLLENGAVTAE